MFDCVYRLSPGPLDFDELRYSLRCLEANTRAERVHFFGGKPEWLKTDLHKHTEQPFDKWKNARIQWRAIIQTSAVSDPFWAFDDDFYVLQHVGTRLPLWHGGEYGKWLDDLGPRFRNSDYVRNGRKTIAVLKEKLSIHEEWEVLCWSLHTPILVYKAAMTEALDLDAAHGQKLHLRTLYGNIAMASGMALFADHAPVFDVKGTKAALAEGVYASSYNSTWHTAPLGKTIRARYPSPSRWETS